MKPSPSPVPDARSHLPKAIERLLLQRYSDTLSGRIGASSILRGLSVLFRKHPRAAFAALLAGTIQAGRTGMAEARNRMASRGRWAGGSQRSGDTLVGGVKPAAEQLVETRRILTAKLGKRKLRQLREQVEAEELRNQSDNRGIQSKSGRDPE